MLVQRSQVLEMYSAVVTVERKHAEAEDILQILAIKQRLDTIIVYVEP